MKSPSLMIISFSPLLKRFLPNYSLNGIFFAKNVTCFVDKNGARLLFNVEINFSSLCCFEGWHSGKPTNQSEFQ